ncbi:distal membrane-arm assembly complex protein 2-like [Colletes gigas]|uniref:distal membrane-arm assembly complex protein 2-like n=1 Tax=Colletes gigas TaxID=935657 RepID=UPI001C9AA00B|nr:distal membrane-arm assembly complex protein 2-like [Colletes gigas]XP_043252327.1 distal membrane-arm assembly complex protein 2-like [Colletes gigas]
MLLQHFARIVPKQSLNCITSFKNVNIARTFYNDKKSVVQLTQNRRKQREIAKLKHEHDLKKPLRRPTLRTSIILFSTAAPEVHDFWTLNLKHWWAHQKVEYRKFAQERTYEKYVRSGPDVATAQFVLKYGGRIKLRNHNDWIDKDTKGGPTIPKDFDPHFNLEGIDLRGYPLEYDNLRTICDLYHLKWLSLKGCSTINDWAVDKIAFEYPMLEHLDISECINVTERSLEALYKIPNLKSLVVTKYHDTPVLELTCIMLEDVNPHLKCHILMPETKCLLEE